MGGSSLGSNAASDYRQEKKIMSGFSSSPPFVLFFLNKTKGEAASPIFSDAVQSWQGLKKLQFVYTILQIKEIPSSQCLRAQGLFLRRFGCMRKNPRRVH